MNNKQILSVFACFFLATTSLTPLSGAIPEPVKDDPPIIIIPPNPNYPGGPRSAVCIEASLHAEEGEIEVFLQNAGPRVRVDLVHPASSATCTYEVSGNGRDYLLFSGASGYWTLTFTLSDGSQYYGSFVL